MITYVTQDSLGLVQMSGVVARESNIWEKYISMVLFRKKYYISMQKTHDN